MIDNLHEHLYEFCNDIIQENLPANLHSLITNERFPKTENNLSILADVLWCLGVETESKNPAQSTERQTLVQAVLPLIKENILSTQVGIVYKLNTKIFFLIDKKKSVIERKT